MRLDLYTKNKMKGYAGSFFLRLQHTNPFPAIVDGKDPAYHTYMSCLPRHIREAVHTFRADSRYIEFLHVNKTTKLTIKAEKFGPDDKLFIQTIQFDFKESKPSCSCWTEKAELDPEHPLHTEILQWVLRAREINRDYRRCRGFLYSIINDANTAGQLRTLFPDYVKMLSESQQQHIAGMKKRSRLPKDYDMDFLKEHSQFVAEKIALCLLLPEGGETIWLG